MLKKSSGIVVSKLVLSRPFLLRIKAFIAISLLRTRFFEVKTSADKETSLSASQILSNRI